MTLANRNSRLQATQSFIKMMSDMAEHMSHQVADVFESPLQGQPTPVKSACDVSTRLPNRRRDSMKRMFY